eukprot:12920938-Prorocentrum_lima.AAC.1
MKCASMDMCLVLNAALGPDVARVIAAELSFRTRVLGAVCVHSPKQRNKFVPWRPPATRPTSSASQALKAVKL